MGWAGARLPTAAGLRPLFYEAGPSADCSASGWPSTLGGNQVVGGKIGRGPLLRERQGASASTNPMQGTAKSVARKRSRGVDHQVTGWTF